MIHYIFQFIKQVALFLLVVSTVHADTATPRKSYRRAHAHNDYRHKKPLLDALEQGFCSVEADIFLINGKLLVGHSILELDPEKTLTSLYLDPLRKIIQKNRGRVHPDYPWFTLMIDIKSESVSTYRSLSIVLAQYSDILTSVKNGKVNLKPVRVIISGNRAWDTIESEIIRHCGIDGRINNLNSKKPAHLMPMISDNWSHHFHWRGNGPFPEKEKKKLIQIVKQAHQAGRVVRFWNTPENKNLWIALHAANVDFINTDQLAKLNSFLKEKNSKEMLFHPVYEDFQPIPDVIVRDKKAHIHTQGLYVTSKYYYVTGRLNESPRRALLLRFLRTDPSQYEYIDITPSEEFTKKNHGALDHPGGIDFDGEHLWVPVSGSWRESLSVILKIPVSDDVPLSNTKPETVFEVNDHIGAIAVDTKKKKLYGANWDTLISYSWTLKGKLIEKTHQAKLIMNHPNQKIAVQDWKSLGNGVVMMGGSDKSPDRSPMTSRALIEIIDMNSHKRLGQARIFGPDLHSGNIAHEGFAIDQNYLYFIPEDIGSGARIYRYRWKKTD